MNAYKLNSSANYILRQAISKSLGIAITEVYKAVKSIDTANGVVTTWDGKKYRVKLEEEPNL
jgi:hypothetical protein